VEGTFVTTNNSKWERATAWVKAHKIWSGVIAVVIISVGVYLLRGQLEDLIVPPPKPKRVYFIGGAQGLERRGDVVFIHGLNDNYVSAWGDPNKEFYWPRWLSEHSKDIGVWAVDYDAAASAWLGSSMPVEDRAENLLVEMRAKGIGKRPVIFVCHSLGGIVAKCMVQDGAILRNPEYEEISSQTRGIVFLATPHSGSDSADLMNMANYYLPARKTDLLDQLRSNGSMLRKLNIWYVNNAEQLDIQTRVLYEKLDVPGFGRIVTESSSNPGMTGVFPTPVDASHLTIARPTSADNVVVSVVSEFIEKNLSPSAEPSALTVAELLAQYNSVRNSEPELEGFRKEHRSHRFTWDVFIREVYPQDENSSTSRAAYQVSETMSAKGTEWILARFARNDVSFDKTIRKGTRIRLAGVLSKETRGDELILKECQLLERLPPPADSP
jgi:hypothetical protein